MKTLIIIPSRLSATRLRGKPLLKINGLAMISHVFNKAVEANIGEVFVATEDKEIIDEVEKNGGKAVLTGNHHKTGTDRIFEAVIKLKKPDTELVMNLQGDEPLMNIEDIQNLHNHMVKTKSQMGTLASLIKDKDHYQNKNFVKVITKDRLDKFQFSDALNFTRAIENTYEKIYHHLGIYCFQLDTLKKFVTLEQSPNEIKNSLEQLRALDNNIEINVALAKSSPIGVDTEEDYLALKKIMEYKA